MYWPAIIDYWIVRSVSALGELFSLTFDEIPAAKSSVEFIVDTVRLGRVLLLPPVSVAADNWLVIAQKFTRWFFKP
jgi:hypothetical protein